MKRILMLIFSIFLFSVLSVNAPLSCSLITDGTCNDATQTVYKMEKPDTNAHAGIAVTSTYLNEWCCSSPRGDGQEHSCSLGTNTVIRVSAPDNALVEKKTFATAGYTDICFRDVDCDYVDAVDCSGLGLDYQCVGSMSAYTNAHVGDCTTAYLTKICCKDRCFIRGEGTCISDVDCCDTADYCALIDPSGIPTTGHCCEDGFYWDDFSSQCIETAECYPDICTSLPLTGTWFADANCVTEGPTGEACCEVGPKFGEDPFYDYTDASFANNIKVYGPSGEPSAA